MSFYSQNLTVLTYCTSTFQCLFTRSDWVFLTTALFLSKGIAHCASIALSITASREAVGTITVRHQHWVTVACCLTLTHAAREGWKHAGSVGTGYLFRILFTASTAWLSRISFSYAYWCMFNKRVNVFTTFALNGFNLQVYEVITYWNEDKMSYD